MVRVWERGTGVPARRVAAAGRGPPEQLAFGPDGKTLFAGRIPGRLVPWVARDLARRRDTNIGPSAEEPFTFQTFTADARYGVVVDGERVVCWDLAGEPPGRVVRATKPTHRRRRRARISGGWRSVTTARSTSPRD